MNNQKQRLITKARETKSAFWNRIAKDLEGPSRRQRAVNLSRIDRHSKDGELIIVPGKVLGDGHITHKVTVAAYSFSQSATEKLKEAKCTTMSLDELLEKDPKKYGRIIG